jgi:two-component system alkaline phosphatase synthesis response regulator PhoP
MIYLLEDDNGIRELVLYTLNSSGMEAKGFGHPEAFWSALEERVPDLLLLDIMLPEEDGLTILGKLRRDPDTMRLPVLLLTAKGTEYDKVVGLDAGADDYLAKPFGMMELLARIRALLRRSNSEYSPDEIRYRELSVSPSHHQVLVHGQNVDLTFKEFELLQLFAKHPNVIFSREKLLNVLWGCDYDGESRTVDVHIASLRQKLGDCGSYIETVRGIGYRLGGGSR